MIRADLHLHSTASDGVLSPEKLTEALRQKGIALAALTDHDTFAGSDRARACAGVEIIPGVELTMADMPGLHILCYGLGEGAELREAISALGERRRQRARAMCRHLADLGMPLEDLCERPEGTVGRPQIARAMIAAGYVRTMREAFERWIGDGRPAYIPSERLAIAEALPLIRRSGFVPVLAHPCELKLDQPLLAQLTDRWMGLGLMGLEVYHPSARRGETEVLRRLAASRGLLVTGGSDFHETGDGKHGEIGEMIPLWQNADEDIAALRSALSAAAG